MSQLLQYILDKKHHAFRKENNWDLAGEYSAKGLSPEERMTDRFERLCAAQEPVFLPDEKICYLRTTTKIPDVFTEEEWVQIKEKHFIHELGYLSNLSPNYEETIRVGLLEKRKTADEYSKRSIDAVIALAERYQAAAKAQGKDDIAEVLAQVPKYGARNFREALQFFRILHFSLWLEGNYHNTVGRFDKEMYAYLKADMEKGLYTEETALELVEDFFLSFNKDSDLYIGVQQGDNGQSMVLGGVDENGNEVFNLLSRLSLQASENLLLIDPKINLRVSKNTPLDIYELGSKLTKAGLGFPQYSNDDIVIPALIKHGYDPKDAANYVVAACWEFIIPKVGADVANIGALSYAKAVDTAVHEKLLSCDTFEEFFGAVRAEIQKEVDAITDNIKDLWFAPSPFASVIMDTEDLRKGAKYNNFGLHGTGIATAADSLEAIRKYVYEEKSLPKQDLIEMIDSDFAVHSEWLPKLRFETPKMGQNEETVDQIAKDLINAFADSLEGKVNCRGGHFRAGTGSAMFYLWHANEIGASPDGRRKGEPFGTNFSASLFARINGPISVIQSFTKPDFSRAINGGPLTLEFHHTMFADPDCVRKVAMLVKSFIDMGGHQLQLNAVNIDKMKDAQEHPENYPQLVVRIWGWSAYFVELDKEYQDHVIARQEYKI